MWSLGTRLLIVCYAVMLFEIAYTGLTSMSWAERDVTVIEVEEMGHRRIPSYDVFVATEDVPTATKTLPDGRITAYHDFSRVQRIHMECCFDGLMAEGREIRVRVSPSGDSAVYTGLRGPATMTLLLSIGLCSFIWFSVRRRRGDADRRRREVHRRLRIGAFQREHTRMLPDPETGWLVPHSTRRVRPHVPWRARTRSDHPGHPGDDRLDPPAAA